MSIKKCPHILRRKHIFYIACNGILQVPSFSVFCLTSLGFQLINIVRNNIPYKKFLADIYLLIKFKKICQISFSQIIKMIFFKLGFTSYKIGQPLRGMYVVTKKKYKKMKAYRKSIQNKGPIDKRCLLTLDVNSFRS